MLSLITLNHILHIEKQEKQDVDCYYNFFHLHIIFLNQKMLFTRFLNSCKHNLELHFKHQQKFSYKKTTNDYRMNISLKSCECRRHVDNIYFMFCLRDKILVLQLLQYEQSPKSIDGLKLFRLLLVCEYYTLLWFFFKIHFD